MIGASQDSGGAVTTSPQMVFPREYHAAHGTAGKAFGLLAGGAVMLLVVVFNFAALLLSIHAQAGHPEHDRDNGIMPGFIGGLGAAGAMLLISGIAMLRRP